MFFYNLLHIFLLVFKSQTKIPCCYLHHLNCENLVPLSTCLSFCCCLFLSSSVGFCFIPIILYTSAICFSISHSSLTPSSERPNSVSLYSCSPSIRSVSLIWMLLSRFSGLFLFFFLSSHSFFGKSDLFVFNDISHFLSSMGNLIPWSLSCSRFFSFSHFLRHTLLFCFDI